MTDASHSEDIRGLVRGILITVAPQLPRGTVGIVDELIDANEPGVAVEILSEMLVQFGAVITVDTLSDVSRLVEIMDMDPVNVDRLRPRVQQSPLP